jgi:cell division protein FtsI (penicillin-binding protein 3)
VILDSAVGLHQGGQVSAPVFQRVAQQVLEYLHVPHDVELKDQNRLLLRASVADKDLEESSLDHPGEALWETETSSSPSTTATSVPSGAEGEAATQLLRAGRVQPIFLPPAQPATPVEPGASPLSAPAQPGPTSATGVVLSVDSAVVPSLLGKSLRAAVEAGQEAGIVLEPHGFGIAREQSPAPGTRVPRGGRVAVRFAR